MKSCSANRESSSAPTSVQHNARPLFASGLIPHVIGTMSALKDHLNQATKDAMRARDKERVATLRMVNAEVKRLEVDERGSLVMTISSPYSTKC